MRRLIISMCMAGLLLSASTAVAYTFTEDFESYVTTGHPDGYMEPVWYESAGYANKLLPVTTSANHTPGGSKSLLVNNSYGATKRAEQHLFAPYTIEPTDADPINMDYWAMAPGTSRKRNDFVVALSMGEPGTDFTIPAIDDPPLDEAIPMIAFSHPFGPGTGNVRFSRFDGKQWYNDIAGFSAGSTWYNFILRVQANTYSLERVGGPDDYLYTGLPLAYTGGFDRVFVSYEGRSPSGYTGHVDDITVTSRLPEPATLSFLALGGLMLLRRRR